MSRTTMDICVAYKSKAARAFAPHMTHHRFNHILQAKRLEEIAWWHRALLSLYRYEQQRAGLL